MIAIAGLGLVVAFGARDVPNMAYEPAASFTARLESAYLRIASGGSDIGDWHADAAGDLLGGEFTAAPPIDIGGGGGGEPQRYLAVLGEVETDCYVVRWRPGSAPFTGVLAADLPCTPDARLIQADLFVRAASQAPDRPFDWEPVLPVRAFQARWFVPVLILMLLIVLQGLIGISLAFVKPQERRIPVLPVGAVVGPGPRPA